MSLEQQILKYENEFFIKRFCDDIQNLNDRIHDEFIEFGKSGQVFDKDSIVKYLNNLDTDRDIEILSFKIKNIKEDLIIANYISYEKEIEIKALRTSIWKKELSDWKLYFHQGTVVEAN
ncbi:nuclear transport factor 2 family protein [Tissierellaceae bacterium HCP3S3_D8]